MEHVWSWFLDLSAARHFNEVAQLPIPYSEIKAYSDLKGICMDPFEVDLIRKLDNVVLSIAADKIAAEKEGGKIVNSASMKDAEGIKGVLSGFRKPKTK